MRICTYNCMNLFAWQVEPAEPVNPAKPQRELRALAKTLDRVEADFVALQEVGSRTALEDLNSLLKNPFPHVHLAETNSDRGIHLGFFSRHLPSFRSHRHLTLQAEDGTVLTEFAAGGERPLRLQRDLALADVSVAGTRIALLNVHLKSAGGRLGHTLSPLTIRTAEARALADVIAASHTRRNGAPLLVLGDFNDSAASTAFEPLSAVPDGPLFDPIMRELVPVDPRARTYWPKRRSRVDRILLNRSAAKIYQRGSVRIWHGNTSEVASDHFPVSVDLRPEALTTD